MSVRFFTVTLFLIATLLIGYSLIYVPIHWDEGWNLCVARTLLERGHYGCLYNGELTTPRLSTGVVPVYFQVFGMYLFGIDYIASRLLFGLHTFIYLFLFFSLAKRWFGQVAANYPLFLSLVLWTHPNLHPIFLGANGFAEIVLLTYLVATIYLLDLSCDLSRFWSAVSVVAAAMLFSLCLGLKSLSVPFLLFGISASAILSYFYFSRVAALKLFVIGVFSYFIRLHQFLPMPKGSEHIVTEGTRTYGMHQVLGLVLDFDVRLSVLGYLLENMWLPIVALVWILFHLVYKRDLALMKRGESKASVSLLLFTIVPWLFWFAALSIDYYRYITVPINLSLIFAGFFLERIISELRLVAKESSLNALVNKRALLTCFMTMLLVYQLTLNIFLQGYYLYHIIGSNRELHEIARLVNSLQPKTGVVDTYESQLFFLLEKKYTYPSDQYHVELIKSAYDKNAEQPQYDIKKELPAFIIAGYWSMNMFHIYSLKGLNESYDVIYKNKLYVVYQRT